jgi:hypothetical protein
MAPKNATTRLETARRLLAAAAPDPVAPPAPPAPPPADTTWVDRVVALTGIDPTRCPRCAATLLRRPFPARGTPRHAAPRDPIGWDSS